METLPIEVVCMIAGFTTPHTLLSLSQTCRRFRPLREELGVLEECTRRCYPRIVEQFYAWNSTHNVARNYRDLFDLDVFRDLLVNVPRASEVLMAIDDTLYTTEAARLHSMLALMQGAKAACPSAHSPAKEGVVGKKGPAEHGSRDEGVAPRRRGPRLSVKEVRNRRKAVAQRDRELAIHLHASHMDASTTLLPQERQVTADDSNDECMAALAMLHRYFNYEKEPATQLEDMNKAAGLKEWGTHFLYFYLKKFTICHERPTRITLRLLLAWEAIRSYNCFTEGITAEYLELLVDALKVCRAQSDSATADAILLCAWNRGYVTATFDLLPGGTKVRETAEQFCRYIMDELLPALGTKDSRSFHKKVSAVYFTCKACKMDDVYAELFFGRLLAHAVKHIPFRKLDFLIHLPNSERISNPEEAYVVYQWVTAEWDQIDWATVPGDYYAFVSIYIHQPESCGSLLATYFRERTSTTDVIWALQNLVQWRKRRTLGTAVYENALHAFKTRVRGKAPRADYETQLRELEGAFNLDAEELEHLLDDSAFVSQSSQAD